MCTSCHVHIDDEYDCIRCVARDYGARSHRARIRATSARLYTTAQERKNNDQRRANILYFYSYTHAVYGAKYTAPYITRPQSPAQFVRDPRSPCRAPLRGGVRSKPTLNSNSAQNQRTHATRTRHTVGVWGRPSRRAAARSPHPSHDTHQLGVRGGLAAPRRGATVSRCQPLSTRPKNPGNGQETTTAKAAPV